MGKLEGKVALITGGSSGIGLATAQEFVSEGAYVFITGRRERELAVAVKEIGSNISGIRADVSNSGDLDRLFSQIKNDKGTLDIVSRTPAARNMHLSVRSPRNYTIRYSTSMLKAFSSPFRRPFL